MKQILFSIFVTTILVLTACAPAAPETAPAELIPIKDVVQLPKLPTATNFPRIGTATPVPPTVTPAPTATPPPATAMFDDATLAKLMAGTISSAGIAADVEIVDERASGGGRTANITIISDYSIEDSDLLLKLFVLEVGNALRTSRAFSEGSMSADLDKAFLTVVDKQNNLLGTVSASMADIIRFLDGKTSVNEALKSLELTGIFETFVK